MDWRLLGITCTSSCERAETRKIQHLSIVDRTTSRGQEEDLAAHIKVTEDRDALQEEVYYMEG